MICNYIKMENQQLKKSKTFYFWLKIVRQIDWYKLITEFYFLFLNKC